MRKILIAVIMGFAPLALAACGEQPAEPAETVVAEETVTEEPATDAMAPSADAVVPAAGDVEADDKQMGDATERGLEEK